MKQEHELYAFRRHLRKCRFFGPGGRDARADKCNCPFHVDGVHNGQRVKRQSLKTRSRQIADRRLAELIRKLDAEANALPGKESPATEKTIKEAAERFLATKGSMQPDGKFRGDIERGTFRKYNTILKFLHAFCSHRGISMVADIDADALEDFRGTRKIGLVTWKAERQTLITFFAYCIKRKWITTNPAKEVDPPRHVRPNEIVPYTPKEEAQILAACGRIRGGKYNRSGAKYEQVRARAMILLLRHTALRIPDVCALRKDSVSWNPGKSTWRVFLHTQKTGDPVFLPIPGDLKLILDALPLPRNAAQDCPYYFWNGQTSRRALVGIGQRTMAAVFQKSGVKKAHAHRFRHTLATSLLGRGATFEEVADILGNTAAVVRKHYGKWSQGRQDNIDRLMLGHFETWPTTIPVTPQSHKKTDPVN